MRSPNGELFFFFFLHFTCFYKRTQTTLAHVTKVDQTLQRSQLLNTMDGELSGTWLCMYTFTGWIQVTVLIWRQHSAVRIKAIVNSMSCKAEPLSVNDAGARGSNHLPVKIQFFIQSNLHQLTEAKTCGHCYILYLTWWARLIRAEDLSVYTASIFTPHGEHGQ